jgi:hypothetical protein
MHSGPDAPRTLRDISALPRQRGAAGEVIRREANCFEEHAGRMNYQTLDRRVCPIARGTAESACGSSQCRPQRLGQFWTRADLRHLDVLEGP